MKFLQKLFGISSSSSLDDLFEVVPQRDCIFKDSASIQDACDDLSLDDAMKHGQMFWQAFHYCQKHWDMKLSGVKAGLLKKERAMQLESSGVRQTVDKGVEMGMYMSLDSTVSVEDHDEYLVRQAIRLIYRDFNQGTPAYKTSMGELWKGGVALWGSDEAAKAAFGIMAGTLIEADIAPHESMFVDSDDVPDVSVQFPTFIRTMNGYTVRTYRQNPDLVM